MNVKDVIEAITAVAVVAAAAFSLQRLARDPENSALRALVPGLVLLGFTLTASIPIWPLTVLDDVQDNVLGLGQVIWTTMSCCYAAFFLSADPSRDRDQRRRLRRVLLAGLVVAVAVRVAVDVVAGPAPSPRTPEYYRSWANVLTALSCFGAALTFYSAGTLWALRYLQVVRGRVLRAAVVLVTCGAGAMSVGVDVITLVRHLVLYPAFPGVKYPWLSVLYNVGRLGGQLLLAAGLLLMPTLTVIRSVRRRRDQQVRDRYATVLAPLWRRLTAEHPLVVLHSRSLHGSFERRTAEISDALSRLAPFVPLDHPTPSEASSAQRTALLVEAALDARDAARRGGDLDAAWHEGPHPSLEPDFGSDWQSRAHWMQLLSTELERRGALDTHREEFTP